MAISQQKRREILFQLLFSFDFTRVEDDDLNEFIMKEFFVSRSSVREMLDEIKQIAIHLTDLDAKITTYSIAYELHRIPKVELNILRLAIYEMLHVYPRIRIPVFWPVSPGLLSTAAAAPLRTRYSRDLSQKQIGLDFSELYFIFRANFSGF